MERLSVLGATGSIGASTLDVVSRHPQRFRVFALTANRDVAALAALCERHRPSVAVVVQPAAAEELRARLRSTAAADVEVCSGEAALCEVAAGGEADTVVAGIVGAAGLAPTLAAVRAGKRVLLANKEALVMAGRLFMTEVARYGARLLPLDSEHNAVYQCLPERFQRDGLDAVGVRRILLTASGGPFRTRPVESLDAVTPEQACAHPNWAMGRKISVDSATMMNKGLELIEACWLFATEPQRITVVIHPQSIVHSLVEYVDGSVLAQLGNPDMRTPIAHALGCPDRLDAAVAPLDLLAIGSLDFEAPEPKRFPCLDLAAEAMARGGTRPAALNAANEVAVAAFLERRIRFTDIPCVIEGALARTEWTPADAMDQILATDDEARQRARAVIGGLPQR